MSTDDTISKLTLNEMASDFREKRKSKRIKKLLTETAAHDSIYELLLRATTKRRLITEQ